MAIQTKPPDNERINALLDELEAREARRPYASLPFFVSTSRFGLHRLAVLGLPFWWVGRVVQFVWEEVGRRLGPSVPLDPPRRHTDLPFDKGVSRRRSEIRRALAGHSASTQSPGKPGSGPAAQEENQ